MLLQRKAEGHDPPALRDRVVVEAKLLYYRTAFLQLTDSRQFTQSGVPLPIPMSEFSAYFQAYKIEDIQERERLIKYVKAQDRTYCDHAAKKIRQEHENNDKKSKRAVSRK